MLWGLHETIHRSNFALGLHMMICGRYYHWSKKWYLSLHVLTFFRALSFFLNAVVLNLIRSHAPLTKHLFCNDLFTALKINASIRKPLTFQSVDQQHHEDHPKCRILASISGLLNQILYFNETPRWYVCTVKKIELCTDLYLTLSIRLKWSVYTSVSLTGLWAAWGQDWVLFIFVTSVSNSGPDQSKTSIKLYCTSISITIFTTFSPLWHPKAFVVQNYTFNDGTSHLPPGTDRSLIVSQI